MDNESVLKNLNFYNLTITNAILMKLTTTMYLHETFHLAKNWDGTHRVYEGVNEKLENESFALIFTNFLTTSKTVTYVMHYLALHHW